MNGNNAQKGNTDNTILNEDNFLNKNYTTSALRKNPMYTYTSYKPFWFVTKVCTMDYIQVNKMYNQV